MSSRPELAAELVAASPGMAMAAVIATEADIDRMVEIVNGALGDVEAALD